MVGVCLNALLDATPPRNQKRQPRWACLVAAVIATTISEGTIPSRMQFQQSVAPVAPIRWHPAVLS
jgi:hypothetical protein